MELMETRAQLKKGIVGVVGTDTPVAIRMRYVGTGTVTSVTVTTATNIVMVTSDGGTDTYAFATYDTVGKLVDAINADGIFEAIVLDTLREKATASQFVTGAITSSSVREGNTTFTVWDVAVDTSAALYFGYRITSSRAFDKKTLKKNRIVSLQEIKYYANVGTAAVDSVQVYEVDGTTEGKKLSYSTVDATATTINFAAGLGKYTAEQGNDIVVILKDAGTLADAATNYVQVTGESY